MDRNGTFYSLYTPIGGGPGPEEHIEADRSRVSEPVQIYANAEVPAKSNVDARWKAYQAFLGRTELKNGVANGRAVRYLSRTLPRPYQGAVNSVNEHFLWVKSITRSAPLGVVANVAAVDEADAPMWRMNLEHVATLFAHRVDSDVTPTIESPVSTRFVALSPYWDEVAARIIFPDEGWALGYSTLDPGALWNPLAAPITAAESWPNTRFVSKRVDYGSRVYTIRNGLMRYVSDGLPLPIGLPVTLGHLMVTYVWHDIPVLGIPNTAIGQCLGTVNKWVFDSYPPQTMLMLGAKRRMFINPWGDMTCDLEYHFKVLFNTSFSEASPGFYPPRGHNWALRVEGGALDFFKVTSDGTDGGTPPYRIVGEGPGNNFVGAFDRLFRPEQP